ncbi:MAG TPA: hypothetical protein VF466_00010 [Candidatus Saccharimonadales bacterium]
MAFETPGFEAMPLLRTSSWHGQLGEVAAPFRALAVAGLQLARYGVAAALQRSGADLRLPFLVTHESGQGTRVNPEIIDAVSADGRPHPTAHAALVSGGAALALARGASAVYNLAGSPRQAQQELSLAIPEAAQEAVEAALRRQDGPVLATAMSPERISLRWSLNQFTEPIPALDVAVRQGGPQDGFPGDMVSASVAARQQGRTSRLEFDFFEVHDFVEARHASPEVFHNLGDAMLAAGQAA